MADQVYTVSLSRDAEGDLERIHSYLVEQRSTEDADDLVDTLIDHMRTLQHFPYRGSIPFELSAINIHQYRQIIHLPYRIIYNIDAGAVVILVIADGRRDMQTLLERRLFGR